MAKRIGIFVDLSNLYYCVNKKFKNRKIDYSKYVAFIEDLGEIIKSYAYGAQKDNEAQNFIYQLKQLGFTTKYKTPKEFYNQGQIRFKANWDVGIVIDLVETLGRFDMVILGSADGDMAPVVEWLKRKGVDVIVLACIISKDLREVASQAIEIPESLLERRKNEQQ